MTEWDDGTVNHSASSEWNSGSRDMGDLFQGWVLDVGAVRDTVVAHFTATTPDAFEKVVDSYRRGYAAEDQFVVVVEARDQGAET